MKLYNFLFKKLNTVLILNFIPTDGFIEQKKQMWRFLSNKFTI